MMLLLNPRCSHLVVNLSLQIQLFVVMMLGQIFGVSGVGDSAFLILGFFIPTHPATVLLYSDCFFVSKT